jgi:hypothetical protein
MINSMSTQFVRNIILMLRDVRMWYMLAGITLSIVAHELFHIIMHIGHIESIHIFPNFFTIVEITTNQPGTTSLYEELIAYSITAVILLITIIDVFAIHDSRAK